MRNVGQRGKKMITYQKIKNLFSAEKKEEQPDPNAHLTLGIPVRMLENNTTEDTEGADVYGISQQELLKFLKDNHFEQIPVHMRK